MAIITLLTDFGLKDEFVGVLKGVILSTAPDVTIVDISHGVDPQDIVGAAHALKAAYAYFPDETIHVAVVDPGVGTPRGIIAARCNAHLFLAPDNGLLSPILQGGTSVCIHGVENEKLFRHPVSRTFHGRDVFAPVAAHLSNGYPLASLGAPIEPEQIQPLARHGFVRTGPGQIEGRVVDVDRFGNLITNIEAKDLSRFGGDRLRFTLGDCTIDGMVDAYADGEDDSPAAIIGSRDCLEIAIYSGNASRRLNLGKGDVIRVVAHSEGLGKK
jgi:S-adenosyl-L-methionine hydrolase (adenosine-forming)